MKIGIVLAGGGAKGAYQVGVLRALEEFGIMKYVTTISGSSVGALNSIMYTQGYDTMKDTWDMIESGDILHFKPLEKWNELLLDPKTQIPRWLKRRLLPGILRLLTFGIFSRDGLKRVINKFNLDDIAQGNIDIHVCVLAVKGLRNKYINARGKNQKDLTDLLLASSAIPIAFKSQDYKGEQYYDGGLPIIGDNFPVKPLKNKCEYIIGVDMSPDPKTRKKNAQKCDCYIASDTYFHEGKTLNFNKALYVKMVDLGYYDAGKILLRMIRETQEKEFRKKINSKKKNINDALEKIAKNIDVGNIEQDLISIANNLGLDYKAYTATNFFGSNKSIDI